VEDEMTADNGAANTAEKIAIEQARQLAHSAQALAKTRPTGWNGHRSTAQKRYDQRRISELFLRGWPQYHIAEAVALSENTVSADLKEISQAWIDEAKANVEKAKAQELAKISLLEKTHWEAYERSCEMVLSRKLVVEEDMAYVESIVIPWAKPGNSTWLRGVRECIQDRCKILGVQAPTEHHLLGKNGGDLIVKVIGGIDLENDI